MLDIDKYLNDFNKNKLVIMDKEQEKEIITKSILFALNTPGFIIIVDEAIVKENIIKDVKYNELASKEMLKSIIKTKRAVKKLDGYTGYILLFMDLDSLKNEFNWLLHQTLYVKGFVRDELVANIDEYKVKENVSKEQFEEAIKLSLSDSGKENDLINISVDKLTNVPVIFYKGKKMSVSNFVSIDYSFRFETDQHYGRHEVSIELDEDNSNVTTTISHTI